MHSPVALIVLASVAAAAPSSKDVEFFESRIRPVLVKNCHACHTRSRLGGLQLDTRESALKGGKTGPALIPGNADDSLLMQVVSHKHVRLKMPPVGKLAENEIQDLAQWIKAGAVWPEAKAAQQSAEMTITPEHRAFWAFQPVRKTTGNIDAFLRAKWQQAGVNPVKKVGRAALLRRATFDLTGLPPTPEELDAFLADDSAGAFAKVVDRLLASSHYGERYGRHWLDLARYADGALGASNDTPYENAHRYRDWVIRSLNEDLPYDQFVKAQIAADMLPQREKHLPALGFQALGGGAEDQLDVTTRTFLGLTVGCAQCHDHKYDPIPTRDYYSMLGIFRSSARDDFPLAPEATVKAFKEHQQKIDDAKFELDQFVKTRSAELSEYLAAKTTRYLTAAWRVMREAADSKAAASAASLDAEVMDRWVAFLRQPNKDHSYVRKFEELIARKADDAEAQRWIAGFQTLVSDIFRTRAAMEERNYVKLGGIKGIRDEATRQYTNLESLEITKYYLWRDLASDPYRKDFFDFKGGVYYYGEKNIDRWLSPEWKEHLDDLRARYKSLKDSLPSQYPFIHSLKEAEKPKDTRIAIRGDANNLGEEAPRRFLRVLCDGDPPLYTEGSGRRQLAEAIANAANPLTARVIANRVWHWHFSSGIVRSPSNFGQLGERPTHPELLDYLATRLTESGWSLKALHREIMLSEAYALSSEHNDANASKDPDNKLHWRANLVQRLDAEALRDAMLSVAGNLDKSAGGAASPLDDKNHRRAVYGYIGRTKPDPMLTLFDFPNPNSTSEQRVVTMGPLQRLYFLNNSFAAQQAQVLADRLAREARSTEDRIRLAYRLLYSRLPLENEIQAGIGYLGKTNSWPQYAQVLLTAAEFGAVR